MDIRTSSSRKKSKNMNIQIDNNYQMENLPPGVNIFGAKDLVENSKHSKKKEEEIDDKNQFHKRRSKTDIEGRNYECNICRKCYLSYPALYTHCKIKHNTNNSSGRSRGRPKKDQNENELEKRKYNPINYTFFSKEERTGRTDPKTEINNCIDTAFSELYSKENKDRNALRNMKYNILIEEHPFLYKFKQDKHDIYRNVINEYQIIDIVLIDYLNKMSMFCNPQYFTKLIKFVTLFREHVNKFNYNKTKKNSENKEYTEVNDAENFPDSANEFITKFLHPKGKETDFGFNKEESIDLTQNLCYWMYENNYTCSKLSLIDDE
jgi:ribosomal protein L40E